MKNIIILAVIILPLVLILFNYEDDTEQAVKTGKAKLECYISDGWKTIPPEKIKGLLPTGDGWEFTNGYARNCIVIH